jgi:hypothetical protein
MYGLKLVDEPIAGVPSVVTVMSWSMRAAVFIAVLLG